MKASQFVAMLPAETRDKLTRQAADRWFKIYRHVFDAGFTDRFDSELDKKLGYPSDAVIARTLRQMAEAGLLKPNRVVVKYTEIGRAFLGIGMRRIEGPPPGAFIRYTMPGLTPDIPTLDRGAKQARSASAR
ncbi:MAG: hypothetical protein QOE26_1878 [Verrucomicrobiota bacterium]|jgi:hypothetical protein